MTTTNTPKPNTQHSFPGSQTGATFAFENICDPGAYICNWSGHLLRVPEDGVTPGRSPMLSLVGPEQLYVTKISDNPYITVTKAKLIAANMDVCVNF